MLPLRRSVADLSLFCEKCLQPLRAEVLVQLGTLLQQQLVVRVSSEVSK